MTSTELMPLTPVLERVWKGMLDDMTTQGHPLRNAEIRIRKFRDLTLENERESIVLKVDPFTWVKMESGEYTDVIPLDGDGTYEFDAKILPGGTYPVQCAQYELVINNEPAYNRKTGTFHSLIEA